MTADPRDLHLTRLIAATPDKLYRAWTDPALMVQWFTPKPWETIHAETDLRPGGANLIVMRGPDGTEMPNRGVYLEVIPNEKLVFTDAYTSAWEPSEKPFMTVTLTFTPEAGGTRYSARVRHWTIADRDSHAEMGFDTGWGQATDQLEDLVTAL